MKFKTWFQSSHLNTGSIKNFLSNIKVLNINGRFQNHIFLCLEYNLKKSPLRFVKISFNSPVFDRVTKDRAAKFVDMLSAIGGTMGLLTGFSIISGVEIFYFTIMIIVRLIKRKS